MESGEVKVPADVGCWLDHREPEKLKTGQDSGTLTRSDPSAAASVAEIDKAFFNELETIFRFHIVRLFPGTGQVKPQDIAIITPYRGQLAFLRR